MLSLERIQEAHTHVKSGKDFPAYIQSLKDMGVTAYEKFVSDGRVHFYGVDNISVVQPAEYPLLDINASIDIAGFKEGLIAHQKGDTDYPTFIKLCAEKGIEKWIVSLNDMTCVYIDVSGLEILKEYIPST